VDAISAAVLQQPVVRTVLGGSRYRLLSFDLIDDYAPTPKPADRFKATVYDYTRNRAVLISGSLALPSLLSISYSDDQPVPNAEEFHAAVDIVRQDPLLGPLVERGQLLPYRPMPPLVSGPLSRHTDRTLTVGLLPGRSKARHEIVGVDMVTETVIRYATGAPESSAAEETTCGPVEDDDADPRRGTPGQTEVTISRGGTVLWHFYAVRPSASSGTNGSGIEIRYVDYKGRRVLARAHVPIVNVDYSVGECGPFRDWLWQEGSFRADGVDLASGHRQCAETPLTVYDDGVDAGQFYGVAYFLRGDQVVLASEMRAGWYRYVQEWSFAPDGTMRPRFRFAAVANSCTCKLHVHHAYWRFDFDVDGAHNDAVDEYNDPPVDGPENWRTIGEEAGSLRAANRQWRVRDTVTDAGYSIEPNAGDGATNAFGVGDFWALRNRASEIDDHRGTNVSPDLMRAGLNDFLDGESIWDQDVAVWYGIHVGHVDGDNVAHVGGPDLVPINWS
jgi:hypothetical protein